MEKGIKKEKKSIEVEEVVKDGKEKRDKDRNRDWDGIKKKGGGW